MSDTEDKKTSFTKEEFAKKMAGLNLGESMKVEIKDSTGNSYVLDEKGDRPGALGLGETRQYSKDDESGFREADDFASTINIGRIILWTSLVFIAAMIFWSYFSILDEVTVAQGQVIPSSKNQMIQSLEGGIIEEVLVAEGEAVSKGQVLVRMDDVFFFSAMKEGRIKEVAYKVMIMRIEAELNNKPFVVPKEIEEKYPELAEGERNLYNSSIIEIENLQGMKKLLESELAMTEPLLKKGAVSVVEVLRLKHRVREIDAEINKFRTELLQRLSSSRTENARLQASNVSLQDKLDRTELRSPVEGIVKQIYIPTKGGVVNPGVPIMEILPVEDNLLIEARLRPQDIGFLRIGQAAMIKVSAYDFSIYGGLKGKVTYISADTSVDSKGGSYYEIWIRADKNYLEKDGKKLEIIPGMQVFADIITGQKSILNYILKPILKTKYESFRER